MSWAAAATAAGSVASGLLGGGGGSSAPDIAPPVNVSSQMGDVRFGDKILGSDALAAAPSIADAQSGSVVRWLPWAIGGAVVLVLGLALIHRRARKA